MMSVAGACGVALAMLAGCGQPSANRGKAERAPEEQRVLLAEVDGLKVSVQQAITDPAGLLGGTRPDAGEAIDLAAVLEGNELTFLEPLGIMTAEGGRPAPYLLTVQSPKDRIVDVDYEHRVLDASNEIVHVSDRTLAQFDESSGHWFVNLTGAALALQRPIDAGVLHRFVMFVRMESGEVRQFSVSLRMFVPPPQAEVSVSGAPGRVSLTEKPAFPLAVHRESISNSGAQRLRVIFRGEGTAAISYALRYYDAKGKKHGPLSSSRGSLTLAPSVTGAKISFQEGEWLGFELAPGESAEVAWLARRAEGTDKCKAQPMVIWPGQILMPKVVGASVTGELERVFRIAPAYVPFTSLVEGVGLGVQVLEKEGSWTLGGGAGQSPAKAKRKYSCQGVF